DRNVLLARAFLFDRRGDRDRRRWLSAVLPQRRRGRRCGGYEDRRRPRVRAQTAHRELFREERLRMTDGTRTPPRVVVWRWGWLAPSETFIRSQLDAYER